MNKFRLLRSVVFFASLAVLFLTGALFAQNSPQHSFFIEEESDRLYGQGVHAFFDNQYQRAITILLKAEELETDDPRVFYFLGLAYLRQKENEKAGDFLKKAAQLEFSGRPLRDYAVSEALRRIQGAERLRIENVRTEERTNARLKAQREREIRYGTENAEARSRLRQSLQSSQETDQAAVLEGDALADLAATIEQENPFGLETINPIATQNPAATREETSTEPTVTPPSGENTFPDNSSPGNSSTGNTSPNYTSPNSAAIGDASSGGVLQRIEPPNTSPALATPTSSVATAPVATASSESVVPDWSEADWSVPTGRSGDSMPNAGVPNAGMPNAGVSAASSPSATEPRSVLYSILFMRDTQTETARQTGRMLGAMFSGQSNSAR